MSSTHTSQDPQSRQEPIGATILTGFLGSGKTTLLNHLLHAPHGMRLAVIVNEFGAVGVDGAMLQGEAQFVELDNGCLCCALNADLDKTLRDLAQRGGFDHIVVETTGMADPLPVAWSFNRPGLSQAYRVDAIVTMVDALNVATNIEQAAEAREQIERADILILSKLDLVSDGGAAAEALVREHNTLAPLVRSNHGVLPWDLILDATSSGRAPPSYPAPRSHDDHNHPQHKASFTTWSYETDVVLDDEALEDLVFGLPANVYRIKGLVRTNTEWHYTLVNGVAGRIDIRPFNPSRAMPRLGLTFIGPNLDIDRLKQACAGLQPKPEAPSTRRNLLQNYFD